MDHDNSTMIFLLPKVISTFESTDDIKRNYDNLTPVTLQFDNLVRTRRLMVR